MQQFLPNTYPAGSVTPCATCPAGFAYLTSTGRSLRNAGQVQVRRRLRNGFTATRAIHASPRPPTTPPRSRGATLAGVGIAQNWLDLDAEYGRSAFDQRHQVTAQAQYTSGAGIAGGSLVDGLRGTLLKDWTFLAQLTTGSGLPLTPVYPGAGARHRLHRHAAAAADRRARGRRAGRRYLNPAAYTAAGAGAVGQRRPQLGDRPRAVRR